jgi:hypothetical protein
MLGSQPGAPMLLSLADLSPLLPGIALWALALALPLTALLTPRSAVWPLEPWRPPSSSCCSWRRALPWPWWWAWGVRSF